MSAADYRVLYADNFQELTTQVRAVIDDKKFGNWIPQGGIAAYTVMEYEHGVQVYTIWFMQAMIKETSP